MPWPVSTTSGQPPTWLTCESCSAQAATWSDSSSRMPRACAAGSLSDHVHVLLGLAATEQLTEDWSAAERSLARASGLIDSLAIGGWDPELVAQQLMVVSQQASVYVQLAVYNDGDRALVAKALDCALRAGKQAESRSSWFIAIEASMLAASCAKLQDDTAAFERYSQRGLWLATAHEHEIGHTGDIPSLPRYLQSWITTMQAGPDRTGEIALRAARSNKVVAADVYRQLSAEVRLPGRRCVSGRPAWGDDKWRRSGTRVRSCSTPCRRWCGFTAPRRPRNTGADPCRGGGEAPRGAGRAHQRGEFPGAAGRPGRRCVAQRAGRSHGRGSPRRPGDAPETATQPAVRRLAAGATADAAAGAEIDREIARNSPAGGGTLHSRARCCCAPAPGCGTRESRSTPMASSTAGRPRPRMPASATSSSRGPARLGRSSR